MTAPEKIRAVCEASPEEQRDALADYVAWLLRVEAELAREDSHDDSESGRTDPGQHRRAG